MVAGASARRRKHARHGPLAQAAAEPARQRAQRTAVWKDVTCASAALAPASIVAAATRNQRRGPKSTLQKILQQPPLAARRVLDRHAHANEYVNRKMKKAAMPTAKYAPLTESTPS